MQGRERHDQEKGVSIVFAVVLNSLTCFSKNIYNVSKNICKNFVFIVCLRFLLLLPPPDLYEAYAVCLFFRPIRFVPQTTV